MILLPAIDLKGGALVQLVGGDPRDVRVELPDPVEQARRWAERGAEWLHVVDLDRAFGTGSNFRIVERILEEVSGSMKVQVGGGVRFFEDVDALLNAGAARVVVGTRAVTDPTFLREAAERYGPRLVVAADARAGEIVVKGWTESTGKLLLDFARDLDALGLGGLLFTDVGLEGRLAGANVVAVKELARAVRTPLIASGGVATIDDLVHLQVAGAWGAIVGMALYKGQIDFEQALEELKRRGHP